MRKEIIGGATLYLGDCMEALAEMSENQYQLAIVDPPYGIGFGEFNRTNRTSSGKRVKADKYHNSKWDTSIPTDEYFEDLFHVSKNQIIWGGNYFDYIAGMKTPNLKTKEQFDDYIKLSDEKWLFWYKQNPVPNFADGELAWLSFKENNQFNFRYYGNLEGNTSASEKIHPTQKPIKLYAWLLKNYAKPEQTILDTHMGSGSSVIACLDAGHPITAYELDEEYFNAACKRIEESQRQQKLF